MRILAAALASSLTAATVGLRSNPASGDEVAAAPAPPARPAAAGACLSHTSGSLEEAALRFLAALEANDEGSLRSQVVNEREFRDLVWPYLPASRPEMNLTPEFAWRQYAPRNEASLRRLLAAHAGAAYQLVAVVPRRTESYGPFRLLEKPLLVLLEPDGRVVELRLFGSVLEESGRYKVYGFRND